MGIIKLFNIIDHISFRVDYVKANAYKNRIKLIFHIVQVARLWKKPVPSFRNNKSA